MSNRYVDHRGLVGVVISVGWGGGFSSWGDPQMATDPQVVELVHNMNDHDRGTEDHHLLQQQLTHYLNQHYPDHQWYGDPLGLVWVVPGTKFFIHEYDGRESVWCEDQINWITA